MTITAEDEDDITRMQIHSSAGGEHAALQRVVSHLRDQAGKAFASGKDDEAIIVRRLANEIDAMRADASTRLQRCINECDQRRVS